MPLTREQRLAVLHENFGETDCGVAALSAVAGITRAAALKLAAEFGYTEESGTPRGAIERSLNKLRIETRPVEISGPETPATFALRHEYGTYLVYCHDEKGRGHVMALLDGDLFNSRGSWHDRCDAVTEVLR